MNIIAMAVAAGLLVLSAPLAAQQSGRPQDGFYSGQTNGQYSGQADQRVDGRGSHNEGLPPSAADKTNRRFENPLNANDCAEVNQLTPDARPGYQARVQDACEQ